MVKGSAGASRGCAARDCALASSVGSNPSLEVDAADRRRWPGVAVRVLGAVRAGVSVGKSPWRQPARATTARRRPLAKTDPEEHEHFSAELRSE